MNNSCLPESLFSEGIIGPFSLSSDSVDLLPQLVKLASGEENPRNCTQSTLSSDLFCVIQISSV